MKKMNLGLFVVTTLVFAACTSKPKTETNTNPRNPAQSEIGNAGFAEDIHRGCAQAVLKTVFDFQVRDLRLNREQKAEFAEHWYGDTTSIDPKHVQMIQQIKIICAQGFILATPLDTRR